VASLLQQLENNEAMLLMYLADELPADDRVEVEQMLASDAGLRAELESLGATHAAVMSGLSKFDKATPLPVSESVAARSISRLMKQWQIDRLARQPAAAPRRAWRVPWWVYSGSVAAAVLLAVVAWWGLKSDVVQVADPRGTENVQPEEEMLPRIVTSLYTQDDNGPVIAEAEREVSSIANRSDDAILMFEPGGATNQ